MDWHAGRIVSRNAGLKTLLAIAMIAATLATAGASTTAPDGIYGLTFPVAGDVTYTDTWGAPRSEGRTHKGADIFAPKGTPVVAAAEGTVIRIAVGQRAGRYIVVEHVDDWRSYYLHLDNDSPGTDDGLAGAPAPGIEVGVRVDAGDVLDYVGDSGNAEETPSHLHFELHRPDGTAINPTPHLRAAESATDRSPAAGTKWPTKVSPPAYQASNTELIGHLDPGTGFTAGIAVHNDVAYLGTWGRPSVCPGSGVRMVDVSDPTQPTLIGSFAVGDEFPGTSTDSVWVDAVSTESFAGDLAVVAVRLCDTTERHRRSSAFRGLAIYDVTDPALPSLLATMHSGDRTQGVNEVTAAQRSDGGFVIAATVMQSLLHTDGVLGDFRVIEASDPYQPTEVSDWDLRREFESSDKYSPIDPVDWHTHSAWLDPEGTAAWLATWDGGVVMLDLSDINAPELVAHIPIELGGEGNAHTVGVDQELGLLIRNDERLVAESSDGATVTWGAQTIYDVTDAGSPSRLATFATAGATTDDGAADYSGYFSAHEVVVSDGIEYVSWYSDGLRIVDLGEPSQPEEIGSFVPAPATDPLGFWRTASGETSFPMVWGVSLDDGLIFLSDMNSGLWVVRYSPPAVDPQPDAGSVL